VYQSIYYYLFENNHDEFFREVCDALNISLTENEIKSFRMPQLPPEEILPKENPPEKIPAEEIISPATKTVPEYTSATRKIRCKKCSQMFDFVNFDVLICSSCQSEKNEKLNILREFVRARPGISVPDLSRATGIPMSAIIKLVNDGMVGTVR